MKSIAIALAACLALAACATRPISSDDAVETARLFPSYEQYRVVAEHTSIVVVKRDRGLFGSGCATHIFVNGAHVADLRPKEKVTLHVPFGYQVLSANSAGICGGGTVETAVVVEPNQPRAFRVGVSDAGDLHISPTAF